MDIKDLDSHANTWSIQRLDKTLVQEHLLE